VIANNGATVTNTEVTTLNLAAKVRSGEIAALMAEGYSAQTAAVIANNGAIVTNTELLAANALAAEADTAAQIELRGATIAGSAATTGWRAALAGVGEKLTSPTGLIAGAALAAAGIYYLSTIQSEASRRTNELTDAYDRQAAAQKNVRDTAQARQTASSDLGSAERSKADATDQLRQARAGLDKLLQGSAYTSQQVADAERHISDAEAGWRDANQRVIDTEKAKKDAVEKAKAAIDEQRDAVKKLTEDQIKLGDAFKRTAIGARGGDGTRQLAIDAENYAKHLRDVARDSKSATAAQRFNLKLLADTVEATGKIPDEKTIRLTLNDSSFYNTLQKDLGLLKGAGAALVDAFTGGAKQGAAQRGGVSIPVDDKKTKQLGTKAGSDFSTAFVTHIDASGIKTAFTDAITQAQSQLVSETGTLASTIATALDAKLKAETLPATRQIAALQAQIATLQGSTTARDSAQAIADAQKKLDDLQRVLGGGALTSDQAQQIAQARTALADAQDAGGIAAKQAQAATLQAGIDTATKANDAAKAASQRRLDDLTAQLNDGLITQATYVKRLNAMLAKEGINYKTTGKLLGVAFADGFRDGLASIIAQAATLGSVGQGTLRRAPRGTKAIDPNKAEADAIQAFIDQVAQSGGRFTVSGADKLPAGVTLAEPARARRRAAQRRHLQHAGERQAGQGARLRRAHGRPHGDDRDRAQEAEREAAGRRARRRAQEQAQDSGGDALVMINSYLELNGLEIANGARTNEYIRRGLAGPYWQVGEQGDCSVLWRELACLDPASCFVSPAADPAPWYSPDIPASAKFLGVLIPDLHPWFDGLASRAVTPRASGLGGASIGPMHDDPRPLVTEGWLVAEDAAGIEYGRRWLQYVLGQACDPCNLAVARIRSHCPPDDGSDDTEGEWLVYEVGLTAGVKYTGGQSGPGGNLWGCENMMAISWTLETGIPYLYGRDVTCTSGSLNPEACSADCLDFCHWLQDAPPPCSAPSRRPRSGRSQRLSRSTPAPACPTSRSASSRTATTRPRSSRASSCPSSRPDRS
jgi:hypothetical protein